MQPRNNNFESSSVLALNFSTYRNLILFMVVFFICASAIAQETPNLAKPKIVVPDQIAGVTTVSAEQLIELLTSDKPTMLIDARIKEDRDHGYIETSISLLDIETNCNALKGIIADKKQALLFYCNGVNVAVA